MKGIAVETVLYAIILVIGLIIMTMLISKLVPFFGDMIDSVAAGIKNMICKNLGFFGRLVFGCKLF